MNKNFICTNCGDCCGPVPVTKKEVYKIKKEVSKMSLATIHKLKSQSRVDFNCMFRDKENNKCSIYKVRPDICRMFGYYQGLMCPNNPEHATRSKSNGDKRMKKNAENNPVVGVLSINITWDTVLKG